MPDAVEPFDFELARLMSIQHCTHMALNNPNQSEFARQEINPRGRDAI